MYRILLLLTLACTFVFPTRAQYVRVNYDKKTVAAMVAAYGTETVAEAYYNEQVKAILERYNAAEIAAAGIFTSKFLDRKGLTELGIWSSHTENQYYRRIYHLVSVKIMPKIWTVAGMMLRSPQTALYWGSYLMKICTEVKTLCMQFESVVTNGSLSFSDIAFLQLNPQVASLFTLSENGGIDWETFLDDLGDVPHHFTKENLKADLDKLYNMGVSIATAGTENLSGRILGESSFHDLLQGNVTAIAHAVENSYDLYQSLDNSVGSTLLSLVGGPENVAGLFQLDNYNLTAWMTDYLRETMGQYQTEQVLSNSERYAGWSRAQVEQLNRRNDGNTYSISYYRSSYIISKGGKQTKKAYAYSIKVTKSWNHTEEVYEDVFDSYTMDLNTFKGQLQARLSEYNENEEGTVYYIGSDAKNYYQATDEAKLKGSESVMISVTCHEGVSLISGITQYKCRSCGSSLNAHSKECVMRTSVSGDEVLDLSGLDELEQEYNGEAAVLQARIDRLKVENAELVRQIASATVEEAAVLRQAYNRNKDEIGRIETELSVVRRKQEELAQAKEEAAADNDVPTDDYYRIPAIMQDCKAAYDLTWKGEGWWSGYTYLREAVAPNINGVITFRASLQIARKPKYFLGIKIHRAIMEISWELTAEYSDTEVVDIIQFDPEKSETEKKDEVNSRLSEIAREYPSCKISTEYFRSEPPETDNTGDTYHLLWSSDRLEIARQVHTRLSHIYADLVSLEKMMHYKLSIVDVLRDAAPYINDERGRRLTLVEQCRKRWLHGAAENLHSVDYNGKYEDEERGNGNE